MDTRTALSLLGHERRRAVVAVLDDTSPLTWPELVARLATRVADDPQDGHLDDATRRRLRIGLYHKHLPRLADANVVEYDDRQIAATPRLQSLVPYLTDDHRDPPASASDLGEQLAQFYA